MMSFLSTDTIAFTLLGYPLSYLEIVSTLFGLLSVWLAARANIFNWPAGIVNEFGFFLLFYQVNLYADMFLQCVFFVMTVYGWILWRRPETSMPIRALGVNRFLWVVLAIGVGTAVLGSVMMKLHLLLPNFFPEPAAHPFIDSMVTVCSIVAIGLLVKKRVEAWLLWIFVDIFSVGLFASREIYLVAIEYGIFLIVACYGLMHWRRERVQ